VFLIHLNKVTTRRKKNRLLHVTCRLHRLLFFTQTLFLFLYPMRTFISNRTVMVIRVRLTLSGDCSLTWHAHQCFILYSVQSVSYTVEMIKNEDLEHIHIWDISSLNDDYDRARKKTRRSIFILELDWAKYLKLLFRKTIQNWYN
jgi:hypothetical protein